MIPGAPEQARWLKPEPRRTLKPALMHGLIHAAFPGRRILQAQPLTDGMRNANFKLTLEGVSEPLVLRVYEHDASLCRKELDILQMVAASVPVPEVIYAQPEPAGESPPFTITRFIEGISFRELKRSAGRDAIAQAASSAGETLAAIARFTFPKPGWLAPGPTVAAPLLESADPMPRFIDLCLASPNLVLRMPADLRHRTRRFVWSWATRMRDLDTEAHLVHGDFSKRNLVVHLKGGLWRVAAVLDWEFAVSSSPLCDIANFVRYEPPENPFIEPHFSTGFQHAGGTLPPDWRELARAVDLVALCEILTHESLPDSVAAEIVELVRATVSCESAQCRMPPDAPNRAS